VKTNIAFSPPERSQLEGAFHSDPFLIGVAGGTASGKTTACERIIQSLADQRVVVLSLDSFYRDLSQAEIEHVKEFDFDQPGAFDVECMIDCLDGLKRHEYVEIPLYDFIKNKRRKDKTYRMSPADVVIVEGILVLHIKEIRDRCNMKIFVDTDDDVRLARRITRDTVERGRDVEGVLAQYTRFVKPAFDKYVLPSKQSADVIIPWREDNRVAVDLITEHIRMKLSQHDLRRIYGQLFVMPSSLQVRGMHTIIRCRDTHRQDFNFYADRLIRMLVETALGHLPFNETTVTTPTGKAYSGVSFARKLCGVSIIRSGEAMENALRACCMGIKIGKILVNRKGAGTPSDVVYEKLPKDIAERHVVLMDPILASGNSMKCALDVLIQKHNVPESKIIVLTLIANPEGIHQVCGSFPYVKVVTTEIDEGMNDENEVIPGIGDFGDRYFGTDTADWK